MSKIVISEIESGIPIPKRSGRGPALRIEYPFASMQVGDSFSVNGIDHSSVRVAAGRYASAQDGWDYTTRSEGFGVRVWRTK